MIPNMLHVVAATKDDYPAAWSHAHSGDAHTHDFIRLLADRLHVIDAKFGLLGQYGNPSDLAEDVVCYLGEGPGHDVITGQPLSAFDVIVGAGGPAAQPAWNFINKGGGVAWVNPDGEVPAPPPEPPPVTAQPYPDEVEWWQNVFDVEAATRYMRANPPQVYPNPRSARWGNRTAYDIAAGMTKEASMAKHLTELEDELGLP